MDVGSSGLIVFLNQTVRERRVEKPVNVEVRGYEVIVLVVVSPNGRLEAFELCFGLVILFPLVPRIAVPNQSHTPHLRRQEHLGCIARPPLGPMFGWRGPLFLQIARGCIALGIGIIIGVVVV